MLSFLFLRLSLDKNIFSPQKIFFVSKEIFSPQKKIFHLKKNFFASKKNFALKKNFYLKNISLLKIFLLEKILFVTTFWSRICQPPFQKN